MTYTFKPIELFWAALTAITTVVLQALVDFDPSTITDWQAWAVGIGAGAVRAGAAALLVAIARMTSGGDS